MSICLKYCIIFECKKDTEKIKKPTLLDMTSVCHIHLKTGDLEHSQQDNVPECHLSHHLKLCVNSTLTLVLKVFTLKINFSSSYL